MALVKSFVAVLDELKRTLEDDADLAAFCQEKYSKTLTVDFRFRKREEAVSDDMPLIVITSPSYKATNQKDMKASMTHRVFLYLWISQEDKEKAAVEIIQLEELVDQAILKNRNMGGLVKDTDTSEGSANDEGWFAPKYCAVKVADFKQEVNQLAR